MTLALSFACSKSEPAQEALDTRDPVATKYVGAPEAQVHKWAKEDSPVVTKFLNGESVPVLANKGDWTEVRIAGGSGFVHAADLTDAAGAKSEAADPEPKFMTVPSPVTAPNVHGTVYIEANVNTEGEVTSTKVISNTTGHDDLGIRNAASLEHAKFYPIVIKGDRKAFVYYYRVDY